MAKTQTKGSISPTAFAPGSPVFYQQCRQALEQLNWTFGYRPRCHVALNCAFKDWSNVLTYEPTTLGIRAGLFADALPAVVASLIVGELLDPSPDGRGNRHIRLPV